MPGLLSQIEQAVGGLDLGALASGTGAQYGGLADAIGGWSDGVPGDFGAALQALPNLNVPQLSIAGNLGQGLQNLLPSLQGDLGSLVGALQGDVAALPDRLRDALEAGLKPLFDRITTLRTLLASDWSCGLVPGFVPGLPAPVPSPSPSPSPPPAQPPTPQSVLTAQQVTDAKAVLDQLPADLGVPSLLRWVHARVGTVRPGYFTLRSLPVFDDLRDPLDTLVRWEAATPAAVQAELQQTLVTLSALVRSHSNGLLGAALPPGTVQAALPAAALGTSADAFIAALETLASAVQAANAAALPGALAAAQSARAALLSANTAVAAAPAIAARATLARQLEALPAEFDARFCRLLVLLQPRATLADLADAAGGFEPPVLPPEALAPITEGIASLQAQLQTLLDAVDVASATQPITDALAAAQGAIEAVEQALVQLTAQAVQVLTQAREAVAAIDLAAVQQQAQAAIEAASTQVANTVGAALGGASAAMGDTLTTVFEAMDAVDPEALAAPVRAAIAALGDVVQQEAVQRLVQVIDQLEALAQNIATLSFAPVADDVIALVDDLRALIAGIDIGSLPDPGPALISEAMGVLPPSLVPLTDPLLVELDGQIAASPIALLQQVKTLPDEARARLLQFSPRQALQPVLQAPFRAAMQALDGFSPAQWLTAGDQALATVRQRLAAQMDIGRLLAEPARSFAALRAELEKQRPSALLAPLERTLEETLQQLRDVLPVGDLAQALGDATGRVRQFSATVHAALDVADHLADKLSGLGDAQTEFDAWLDTVLLKVPETATGTLAAAVADVRTAALAARPETLAADWAAARTELASLLADAAPAARLTRLTLARSRIQAGAAQPAVVAAVPGLAAWLADDATRSAGDGLAALTSLERALAQADTALGAQWAHLAQNFPHADGALAPLLPGGAAAPLRAWVREAVQRQFGTPVLALLRSLQPIALLIATAAAALRVLVQTLDTKLAELLAAPQALADALGSVASLQQRLAGLDLGIYTREVDAIFSAFTDQLDALDPRQLQQPLEAARDRLLGQLTLATLLPPALRGQLDSAHAQLKAKLGSLDPDALLLEPLDAAYRETIEPLVAALDISATIDVIIAWLEQLPDDLRTQIGRVEVCYGRLLASAPPGGAGSGAGVSL